jgi:hypothetical protein
MRRNFLKGAQGNAMYPLLAAAGFYIRWLMVLWSWILSGVLRLLDQGDTDGRSDLTSAAA